ncbi:MAG: ABC transporter ATP-binding protein [Phenylobacterium sp.]|uniref:ABC transporter ATP-binding protein n=1 Tax=Phenylobacterium sp. TaxID=1871053 RepID=UPI0012240E96|nr:ABC transporter ATP-binding protein [Phenylobacterium sp.]TAJ70759.1 MAG: ABC transporter ATP-binding protein [Phenylobacterium sp.]
MSELIARDVTVRRGGRAIVDGVSATLGAGMFVALIGANGAGKSTLLRCLAGLLRPDAGEVVLDGRPVLALDGRDLAKRRAYLPQSLRAEWPISVERLVALGLTPQLPAFGGLPGGFEPRLTRAIEACDLVDHRFQPATTLSGGELARAMLARALIGDPQVLLADEPTSGLDPRHRLDTVGRLRRLAVEEGRLVVATIHDLTLAARHATHLMALRQGRLVAFGPTAATLAPDLLRQVFEVEAAIHGSGRETLVDYLGPA